MPSAAAQGNFTSCRLQAPQSQSHGLAGREGTPEGSGEGGGWWRDAEYNTGSESMATGALGQEETVRNVLLDQRLQSSSRHQKTGHRKGK